MKYLSILFILTVSAFAQEVAPEEIAKLREQLRTVALQLRAAETEKANALATFAASEAKNTTLQEEIDTLNTKVAQLTKEKSEEAIASEKLAAKLNDRILDREKRIKEYAAALAKWKAAYEGAARTAQEKEAERAKLAAENLILQNEVEDLQRKNLRLYGTALEVLDRYENYSLGKALSAREPFVQKTQVALENQVQGYKDEIIDNRISAQPK